jgi:DNA mismatch endonuclease (patch repair protein)
MSRIRSKNTKAEMLLRRAMWHENLRFRIHSADLPGKPDIIIKKYRLAIFVDGGFWHGYQWAENRKKIKTNIGFWVKKIERNMQRDREINMHLNEKGITVMRFWDHEILKSLPRCINQIRLYIESCKSGKIPESI